MTHERSDPSACTNNIRDPVLRSRKLHETIDAKKAQIVKDLDQIYLLSIEAAKCDAEIQNYKE